MSGMYTQAPAPGASGKFANSEKLPSPWSEYGCREIPDLLSAPVQGITISERSQLSSVSQLGRFHPVSPLCSQIALVQSRDCANVLRSLKIAQIPRLHGSYILCDNYCNSLGLAIIKLLIWLLQDAKYHSY